MDKSKIDPAQDYAVPGSWIIDVLTRLDRLEGLTVAAPLSMEYTPGGAVISSAFSDGLPSPRPLYAPLMPVSTNGVTVAFDGPRFIQSA